MEAKTTKRKSNEEEEENIFDPVVFFKEPYNEERLMNNIKLRKIAGLLAGTDSPSTTNSKSQNFCVEEILQPTDIEIFVEGIGNLQLPIVKDTIDKLKTFATKARFGVGEETVLDENFRDTHMIESKLLDVKINEKSLSHLLKRFQSSLDIPEERKLTSHIHNLLIYGPGQFFDRHRDSEKIPNMVGTMVVVLPSPHIGGNLLVEHAKKKHEVVTENLNSTVCKCVCFYSDCWHSVKKVTDGYRIVLTYNIALDDGNLDIYVVDEDLKDAVKSYFDDDDEEDCLKLVFLLNHSYSRHSLTWGLLKGEDQGHASKFLDVAKKLDLIINLALVDINQNCSCGDDYHHYTSEMALIETDHMLVFWVDRNNTILPYEQYAIDNSQICFAKETYKNFKPTNVTVDGPTGNEGFTSDYSYQRAAIVLWQKKKACKIEFELNFLEALKNLHSLTKTPGREDEIRDVISAVEEHIKTKSQSHPTLFQTFVDIALYVKNDATATKVLSGCNASIITVENIPPIIALQNEYGVEFCTKLFEIWLKSQVVRSLAPFVSEFLKAGGNKTVADFLVDIQIKNTTKSRFFKLITSTI